jgi:hypothetical protein
MTTTEVVPIAPIAVLPPAEKVPANRHPAAVYLARLGAGSRVEPFPWAALRYPHTARVRAQLMGKYSPRQSRRSETMRNVAEHAPRDGLQLVF